MPDLAVIMSIYHRDRLSFVRESVESILNQTFTDFHYYITFDGPVKQEVDEYMSTITDERIRLFRLEQNRGLAIALNYMLELILKNPEYKYIARMDADDVSMPERFEKQRAYLISHPDITVLGSWYEEIDEKGKHEVYRRLPTEHDSLWRRYFTRTPFGHSSVMFNMKLIAVVGFYPEKAVLMEDNVLWGRAFVSNLKLANLDLILHKIRICRNFYRKRAGIKYSLRFLLNKIIIYQTLHSPMNAYLLSFLSGLVRISPLIFKLSYRLDKLLE